MVLAWVVGGATLWAVAGAAMAFLVAAVIGRAGRRCDGPGTVTPETAGPEITGPGITAPETAGSGVAVLVPVQRSTSPTGLRAQPHLPCAGVGRSPSHR